MTHSTFDVNEFRGHFPHLQEITHLASCSQGALSRELHYSLFDLEGGLHSDGAPWGKWMDQVEALRAEFAHTINTTPEHIAIVPSASAGAYQVASAFNWTNANIITSSLEFPSVGQVLHAQTANGAEVKFIADRSEALQPESWADRMNDETKLVSVPLVSYHNGARPDVTGVINEARSRGITTFVDAYQGAGVVPIDVQALGCDYLVSGSLKYLLGLAGVAFLYVKDIDRAERTPEFTGWFGRENPFSFDPQDVSAPRAARRFEGGTPSIPAVYAGLAGIRLINGVDQHTAFEHVMNLRRYLCTELSQAGIRIDQPENELNWGPQVAVKLDDPDSAAEHLAQNHIVAAPRNDVLRLALHYYTNSADVDRVVSALRALAQ
jgi:selenocysteine lyase/cysteine desulfurase